MDPGADELDPPPDADAAFAPWDGRRVPVTLIGGYLGAGKTTLVNGLLARTDRPIAVVVNDVGAINIDHRLIARRHGDTVELTDGCICCELNQGLAAVFDQLRARPNPPDHLVIELSGVADPAPVRPWAHSPGFRLDATVVLADAEQMIDQVDDPLIGTAVIRQFAEADVVVVTKADLVDEPRLAATEARLAQLAPDRPIIRSDSPDGLAGLLDVATRRPAGVAATPTPSLFDLHQTSTVGLPDPIDVATLDDLLDRELGSVNDRDSGPVVRAKGVARDHDGGLWLIQVVGRRRSIIRLPMAEQQPPTDLVLIRLRP